MSHASRRHRSRPARARVALAAVVAASVLAVAPAAAFASHRVLPLGVVAVDYRFVGLPSVLPTATYDTRFLNAGREPHVVVAINLGAGCQGLSRSQAMDLFDLSEEQVFIQCPNLAVNGDVFALPRTSDRGQLAITSGQNWLVCFVPTSGGTPHYRLGMISEVRGLSIG